jgi:hypothetical protein
MASLKNIVAARNVISNDTAIETNYEPGQISMLVPHSSQHGTTHQSITQAWSSPNTTGTVIVEVWGASGSSPNGSCCGVSLPGNSGAYSKKTFSLGGNTLHLSTTLGTSCTNSDCCFKGTSLPTCLCYCLGSTNGTMCAGGGRGGVWWCIDGSTSFICCAAQANYCHTLMSALPLPYNPGSFSDHAGCGMVCNITVAGDIPTSSGGDINCPGGISCTLNTLCQGNCCNHNFLYFSETSAGLHSEKGVMLAVAYHYDSAHHEVGGAGPWELLAHYQEVAREPIGSPLTSCVGENHYCPCTQNNNLYAQFLPHGLGGPAITNIHGGITWGIRGGSGAEKITYRGSS